MVHETSNPTHAGCGVVGLGIVKAADDFLKNTASPENLRALWLTARFRVHADRARLIAELAFDRRPSMSKIVPFPGKTRPTALSRPAPVIGITWFNTDDGSWAVILCYSRYRDHCEVLDGIFSWADAITAAKRIARERHLGLASDLGDGDAG